MSWKGCDSEQAEFIGQVGQIPLRASTHVGDHFTCTKAPELAARLEVESLGQSVEEPSGIEVSCTGGFNHVTNEFRCHVDTTRWRHNDRPFGTIGDRSQNAGLFKRIECFIQGLNLEQCLGFIGVGEGIDDLVPFDADDYVNALFVDQW